MPPVTPRRTRRPASEDPLLDANPFRSLEGDLPLGDLLQGHRQGLVGEATGLHQRRNELAAALAQLAVVGVDLPGPLGGQDDQRVLGIDGGQQVVAAVSIPRRPSRSTSEHRPALVSQEVSVDEEGSRRKPCGSTLGCPPTIFRVPTDMLLLRSFKKYPDRSMVQ